MEDIRIMRKTQFKVRSATIGAVPIEIVPYNNSRVALNISGSVAGAVFVGTSDDASNNSGYVTSLAHGPIRLSVVLDGAAVFGPLWAVAGGGQTLTIAETFLDKE